MTKVRINNSNCQKRKCIVTIKTFFNDLGIARRRTDETSNSENVIATNDFLVMW